MRKVVGLLESDDVFLLPPRWISFKDSILMSDYIGTPGKKMAYMSRSKGTFVSRSNGIWLCNVHYTKLSELSYLLKVAFGEFIGKQVYRDVIRNWILGQINTLEFLSSFLGDVLTDAEVSFTEHEYDDDLLQEIRRLVIDTYNEKLGWLVLNLMKWKDGFGFILYSNREDVIKEVYDAEAFHVRLTNVDFTETRVSELRQKLYEFFSRGERIIVTELMYLCMKNYERCVSRKLKYKLRKQGLVRHGKLTLLGNKVKAILDTKVIDPAIEDLFVNKFIKNEFEVSKGGV